MRHCLGCTWADVDEPPPGWLQDGGLPHSAFVAACALAPPGLAPPRTQAEARALLLARLREEVQLGLCPGVAAWCPLCRKVTPLVRADIPDVAEAMADCLQLAACLRSVRAAPPGEEEGEPAEQDGGGGGG